MNIFGRFFEIFNLLISSGLIGLLLDNNALIKFTGLIHGTILIFSWNLMCLECYSSAYSPDVHSILANFSANNLGTSFNYLPPKPYSIFSSFLVYTGIFGFFVVLILLVKIFWTSFKSRSLLEAAFLSQIIFMFLVRSFGIDPLFWLVFFLMIVKKEKVKSY